MSLILQKSEHLKETDRFLAFLKDPLVKEPNIKGYCHNTQKLNEKLTKSTHVSSFHDSQNNKEFFNLTQPEDHKTNQNSILRRQISPIEKPTEHSMFSQELGQIKIIRNLIPLQEEAFTNKKLSSRVDSDGSHKSIGSVLKLPLTSRTLKPQLDTSSFLKLNRVRLPSQKLDPPTSFFSYATHRLNNEDDYSSINYSNASTSINSNLGNYDRLQQKKKFHSIINKLGSNLKKSQVSGLSHQPKQSFTLSKESGSDLPCLESDHISERVHSLPNEESKTFHNEASNFLSELSQLRQATEESWSMNSGKVQRRKKHDTFIIHPKEQNTKGEVSNMNFLDSELKTTRAFEGLDNDFNIAVVHPRIKQAKSPLKPISIHRSGH